MLQLSAETLDLLSLYGDDLDRLDARDYARKAREGQSVYSLCGGILTDENNLPQVEVWFSDLHGN